VKKLWAVLHLSRALLVESVNFKKEKRQKENNSMEPNLTPFLIQYELALKLGDINGQLRAAEQACEYSARWMAEHPELVDQGSRMVSQIQEKFRRIKPEHMARARDAFDKMRILKNASIARDIQKNLPKGTTWRQIMDFARQAWNGMGSGMSNIGRGAMQMFSGMGRSARDIGVGIGGLMAGMASGAATWIVSFLGQYGLTVPQVAAAVAIIAVVCFLAALYMRNWRSNQPARRDPLLESYESGRAYTPPNPYYRPQQI
jgi:hypothetical protein